MSDQTPPGSAQNPPQGSQPASKASVHHRGNTALKAFLLLVILIAGIGSGYLMGSRSMHEGTTAAATQSHSDSMSMMDQVNPPDGYTLPAVLGDVGPRLVAAGGIDLGKFIALYQGQQKSLTDEEMNTLTAGDDKNIVITPQNANFLLNFFWALGLTNQNDVLTTGPMVSGGADRVGGFASTGGWTLGSKTATKLYASTKLVSLTDEQQARLVEVASTVYRPCCNNPAHFPDCNHGMAMLGLLELMASQNATVDQMYEAAKYANAFWYPQQTLEIAIAFKSADKLDFVDTDSKEFVSYKYSSGSGFQSVHQWLSQSGLLEQAPGTGGSCGIQ